MSIERNFPLVEEVVATFEDALGGDLPAYRDHVYRVVNLCYFSGDFSQEAKDKIQIAGEFHDIGIWTSKTLDYLPP